MCPCTASMLGWHLVSIVVILWKEASQSRVHNEIIVLCILNFVYVNTVYRIFSLLSACAYISTGRKPALNNEVRLTARCA